MRIITWGFGTPGHKAAMFNRRLYGKPFMGRTEVCDWLSTNITDLSGFIILELTDSAGEVRVCEAYGTFANDDDRLLYQLRWQ